MKLRVMGKEVGGGNKGGEEHCHRNDADCGPAYPSQRHTSPLVLADRID